MSYGLIWYLIYLLDGLKVIFSVVGIVSLWGSLMSFIFSIDASAKELINRGKVLLIAGFVSGFMFILIPSKKDALIIIGLSTFSETLNDTIKIPPKLMKLLNKELDKGLKGEKDNDS